MSTGLGREGLLALRNIQQTEFCLMDKLSQNELTSLSVWVCACVYV